MRHNFRLVSMSAFGRRPLQKRVEGRVEWREMIRTKDGSSGVTDVSECGMAAKSLIKR